MPELPEVETVARQLAPLSVGRKARRLVVRDAKLAAAARRSLGGRKLESVFRLGKQVVFQFEDGAGERWLAVHLRMTGRLLWRADGEAVPADAAPRAELAFEGGAIDFVDPRRFGTMTWLARLDEARPKGIDPTAPEFTLAALGRLAAGSRQELKTFLLRQDRLVGVGNIYASEILNRARLDPRRVAGSLDEAELRRLHGATRAVLAAAIRACGTTFSDFQDAHGLTGRYQAKLRVYGREGEPCRRCGAPIVRFEQGGRSTYFCPACAE